jgi:hypothetical protein
MVAKARHGFRRLIGPNFGSLNLEKTVSREAAKSAKENQTVAQVSPETWQGTGEPRNEGTIRPPQTHQERFCKIPERREERAEFRG